MYIVHTNKYLDLVWVCERIYWPVRFSRKGVVEKKATFSELICHKNQSKCTHTQVHAQIVNFIEKCLADASCLFLFENIKKETMTDMCACVSNESERISKKQTNK